MTVASGPAPACLVGGPADVLSDAEITSFVQDQLADVDLDGRSLCLLVPDGTRSCPLPLLLDALAAAVAGRVLRVTVLVALGTHRPMDQAELARHLGHDHEQFDARGWTVRNHQWWEPDTFATVGTIPRSRIQEISGGLLDRDVTVRVNRALLDHDLTLIVGPVFPHEVVGFSGGNKYLFPGVADREVIDVSHWLGALIGSMALIGQPGTTPVRALIDAAAALVPGRRLALCVVAESGTERLRAAAFGAPETAWASAAQVSAQVHVRYLDEPVGRVLSIVPAAYDDLWTGAKGFYKVEPVVRDGGEVVLLAPHITQVAATHPRMREIGYHCRDYFLGQWERFAGYPWGELAHSTHLRGAGTWDPVHGERPRVRVTLATGIPAETVRSLGLDYLDPGTVDVELFAAQPDSLMVPRAGEVLYRLRRPVQAPT